MAKKELQEQINKLQEQNKGMRDEQKYTTLEQSQRLKEIGFSAEADSYWEPNPGNQEGYSLANEACLRLKAWGGRDGWIIDPRVIPTFRLDTLLLVLPEWCFGFADRHDSTTDIGSRFFDELHIHFGIVSFNPDSQSSDKEEKVEELLFDLFTTQGEEAIAAAVDLIVLLKEVE